MFAFTESSDIVNFCSIDSGYAYNSFILGGGIWRYYEGTATDFDHCLFLGNDSTDLVLCDSHMSVNITDSYFLDPYNYTWRNLYIFSDATDCTITADNCYGITSWEENHETNTINITNPSATEIAGVGCGFNITLPSYSVLNYYHTAQETIKTRESYEQQIIFNDGLEKKRGF